MERRWKVRTKDLENISNVLSELWDFFTTHCDADETGLVDSISEQYQKARGDVKQELSKNWLRNEVQKLVRQERKEVKP